MSPSNRCPQGEYRRSSCPDHRRHPQNQHCRRPEKRTAQNRARLSILHRPRRGARRWHPLPRPGRPVTAHPHRHRQKGQRRHRLPARWCKNFSDFGGNNTRIGRHWRPAHDGRGQRTPPPSLPEGIGARLRLINRNPQTDAERDILTGKYEQNKKG